VGKIIVSGLTLLCSPLNCELVNGLTLLCSPPKCELVNGLMMMCSLRLTLKMRADMRNGLYTTWGSLHTQLSLPIYSVKVRGKEPYRGGGEQGRLSHLKGRMETKRGGSLTIPPPPFPL
jgi:hypothetical protein